MAKYNYDANIDEERDVYAFLLFFTNEIGRSSYHLRTALVRE